MTSAPGEQGGLRLYRRLLGYVWPYRGVFAIAILAMVALAATSTALAALIKPLLDEGFIAKNPEAIRAIPLQMVGLFLIRGLATFVAEYGVTWVGRKVIFDLRNALFTHLVRMPSEFYDRNSSGRLISQLIYDVEQIASTATDALYSVFRDGLTLVGMLAWMTYLNWRLTLILGIVAPVSAGLVRVMAKRLRKASRQIQLSMGEISQVAQQATEGQREVKAFGGEAAEVETFSSANDRNRRQVLRRTAVSAIGVPIIQFLAAIAMAVIIYVALSSGHVSTGGFVSYIGALLGVTTPTKRLSRINETIQTGLAAAHGAFALLDQPPEPDHGTRTLARAQGRIEYRDVGFCYPHAHGPALVDVSFAARPGETVALVGPSGSGKSTLTALLLRFYQPNRGAILLDGIDTQDIVLRDLRRQIALVGQDTVLFDDTIRNNIAYGTPGAVDEARVIEAARNAYVLEFADKLPQRLDTPVGEKGARLSGGQRQRIAIARALYKDAPILVLDEATSALDSESERYVQAAMQRLMQGRTTLVIAHRLSTIEHADRIVVMQQGRILESGTHPELLARRGAYAGLHRTQFHGYRD